MGFENITHTISVKELQSTIYNYNETSKGLNLRVWHFSLRTYSNKHHISEVFTLCVSIMLHLYKESQ